jgi:RNA polymerase sigma-70 factor (ECF subfamily)
MAKSNEGIWDAVAPLPAIDPEETHWVARACAGDSAGHRWLLERYRTRVVRLAAQVLRRPDEAEDVAQEAFVRAFRKLPSFRAEGRFQAWLFAIVVRTCQDRCRLTRWNTEVVVAEPHEGAASLRGAGEAIDTRVLVEALLDQLSPVMRATLVLRELEGLEYEEIARALEVPVGTVRSRLSAARARFRELWLEAEQG